MSNTKRNNLNPFYLNGKRAMVSLGPLCNSKHCPYSCAFCYVQDEFCSYANLEIDQILDFLKQNRKKYSIIYVSGDTDSFAPPRTKQGLCLLSRIAEELNCDLLFTTRTTFEEEDYHILQQISKQQQANHKKLYACISITRYSENIAYLEPTPIPSPDDRIQVLRRLKELGAVTVLATRPFLPIVPTTDYINIIESAKDYVDIVLGECFYFIRNGAIQKRVFPNGIPNEVEAQILRNQKMPFDDNTADWDIWDSALYQQIVQEECDKYGIVFSMHSDDAIQEYLSKTEHKS